jgi:hypothetical protein
LPAADAGEPEGIDEAPTADTGSAEAWRRLNASAAERLDDRVRPLLLELGRSAWGRGRGRRWELVTSPEAADWRLFRLSDASESAFRFEQLGVRATIDPGGDLVAFQVDNGEEFLALADVSQSGLRRGLLHLLGKGLPPFESAERPFAASASSGPFRWLAEILR